MGLTFSDRGLIARLDADTASKTRLPEWIFTAPRDEQIALIAGLMDSEGFVAETYDKRAITSEPRYRMGFKSVRMD